MDAQLFAIIEELREADEASELMTGEDLTPNAIADAVAIRPAEISSLRAMPSVIPIKGRDGDLLPKNFLTPSTATLIGLSHWW